MQLERDNLQNDFVDVDEKYKEYMKTASAVSYENKKLTEEIGELICDETIEDMQYNSILNVSEIISGWMARRPKVERIHNTYRDTIWNNTDTKIHSVRYLHKDGNTYVDHFLVYFDEFGWEEGVFWLSGQCWLTRE